MGPWEKLQLGWLDYSVVDPGQGGSYTLSPAALQTDGQDQALVIDVPDRGSPQDYVTPNGGHAWWTSSADDLNTTLTRTLDLSTRAFSATVSAKAWYDIEAGYDYLYGEYSTDGGANWTTVGTLSDTSNGKWTTLKYTVPGGNANTLFRFRYQSRRRRAPRRRVHRRHRREERRHHAAHRRRRERATTAGRPRAASRSARAPRPASGDRYYLVENRTYVGYDETLRDGPYQFDAAYTAPDHVEHFPFQDGMLVWAVDETYTDNNTIDHQGHGLALPVDARPVEVHATPTARARATAASRSTRPSACSRSTRCPCTRRSSSARARARRSSRSRPSAPPSVSARQATFSDADPDAYFSSTNPLGGVKVAGHGVTATVTSQVTGGTMTVDVTNPAE